MRVTSASLLQGQAAQLARTYRALLTAQSALSTGKRVLSPSDDPAAFRQALDVQGVMSRLGDLRTRAEGARGELSLMDAALQGISGVMIRAREIAVEGSNGARGQGDRDSLAQEVDGLIDQLLGHLNARGADGALFGGHDRAGTPFRVERGADGELLVYQGSTSEGRIDLGALGVGVSLVGERFLQSGARGTPVLQGSTGLLLGAGQQSGRGTERLLIEHLRSTLDDDLGSGVRLGASSDSLDTVLGSSHEIEVTDETGDGSAGSVSLNGGPAVRWTSADTDLALTGPDGEVVHLDLSNVAAGFDDQIGLEATGRFSLDAGQSWSDVDFTAASQLVVDARTGASVFLDARGLRQAGVEVMRFPGSYDPIATLVDLRDGLRDADDLGEVQQLDGLRGLLDEIDRNADRVHLLLADVGARMQLVDSATRRSADLELAFERRRGELEDADIASAAFDLTAAETQLQAILALSARMTRLPTLMQLL